MSRSKRRLPWVARLVLAGAVLAVPACLRGEGSSAPEARTAAISYVDEPLAEIDVSRERARFLAWRRSGQVEDAVARLDRLLDLFDAARFARDEDVRARAREALWAELGAPAEGPRGAQATHDAVMKLYEVAVRVEGLIPAPRSDAEPPRGARRGRPNTPTMPSPDGWEDARSFVADAVQLLATDTFVPRTAEELAVRTLVHRTLSERGHPRVADNARWRRHDHVVATLEATIAAPARRRAAIGRVVDWDTAEDPITTLGAGDDAPLPTPAAIDAWLALLETHRSALLAEPRWQALVRAWEAEDKALADRVVAGVPAALSDDQAVPLVRDLELSPLAAAPRLVVSAAGEVTLEGSPRPDTAAPPGGSSPTEAPSRRLVDDLKNALLAMGADSVVLAVDAHSPPHALRFALDAVAAAGASEVEFVLRDEGSKRAGVIVVPLISASTTGPLRRAVDVAATSGRIMAGGASLELHVRREGRLVGTVVSDATPTSRFEARWQQVTSAFPRTSVMPMQLDENASIVDLVAVLRSLDASSRAPATASAGGDEAEARRTAPLLVLDHRRAATSSAGAPAPAAEETNGGPRVVDAAAFDLWLAARVAKIAGSRASVLPSIPLPPGDAGRLERVANGLVACAGELVPSPTFQGRGKATRVVQRSEARAASVSVLLPFWDGRVDKSRPLDVVISPKPSAPERLALERCVETSLLGVALASQRDPVEVTLTITTP